MGIISQITEGWAKLVGRKKVGKAGTLQEAAKASTLSGREKSKIISGGFYSELPLWYRVAMAFVAATGFLLCLALLILVGQILMERLF